MLQWLSAGPLRSLLILLALLLTSLAQAHQSGNSYLRISSTPQSLDVQLDFAVRDLDSLLQIPEADRKPLSRDDLPTLAPRLSQLVNDALVLEVDGLPIALSFAAQDIVLHNDGLYVRQQHAAPALP